MISGIQHELIILPAEARPHIPDRLRSAGIEVAPSQKSAPAKFKDAGTIYACVENKGSAEILVIDETHMQPEHQSMAAVLIFPGRGGLADRLFGKTDQALRTKIHEVLYAYKSEITQPSSGPNRR